MIKMTSIHVKPSSRESSEIPLRRYYILDQSNEFLPDFLTSSLNTICPFISWVKTKTSSQAFKHGQ